ncbi:unnamed protein product [Closterium sp. NIES-65]|nr:unnamed protein product [Closterium sp. NIES-65]
MPLHLTSRSGADGGAVESDDREHKRQKIDGEDATVVTDSKLADSVPTKVTNSSNRDVEMAPQPTSDSANGAATGAGGGGEIVIDEDLHSRQLAVYGRETMKRMFGAKVLISGLNGLGVEIAKNVILAGVKSVTVHDTVTVTVQHLSAQFFLTEADVGVNRAQACAAHLQELNKAVEVHVHTAPIEKEFLGDFQELNKAVEAQVHTAPIEKEFLGDFQVGDGGTEVSGDSTPTATCSTPPRPSLPPPLGCPATAMAARTMGEFETCSLAPYMSLLPSFSSSCFYPTFPVSPSLQPVMFAGLPLDRAIPAVVFTDLPLDQAIEFDAYCHAHNPSVPFIRCETRGVFGAIFCDFGPKFTVTDVDGEEPFSGIVASVAKDSPDALVTCVDDERLGFQDGDLVVFSEVRGMTELNDGKPRRVRNVRAHSFLLDDDTSAYGAYESGGIVTQVKEPKELAFRPLSACLEQPGEFLLSDFAKFDRPPLLHLAFQALDAFRKETGRFPAPGSEGDGARVVELVREVNGRAGKDAKVEEGVVKEGEGLIRQLAHGASAEICPMAAMFGGIVGQEVVKACSGKFHPLFQLFYFDSVESLPAEPLSAEETAPTNTRYDSQIALFGRTLQARMHASSAFVVGAGALGCELLKNLALMGVCCTPPGEKPPAGAGDGGASSGESVPLSGKGYLTVTDDDTIEKSNLSRQFLFRDWNIGHAKSSVAAVAARVINPALRVNALQNRVGPQTEDVFDDTFWEHLDVVINALDNVNARLYVDSRCLYFNKPLLESGTLGAKCNTQMVVPHETENYGASRDPPERQAPMCTVHSFPHNITHCLTWARSEFEGLLERTPSEANAFLSGQEKYCEEMMGAGDAAAREALERVVECLVTERASSFDDCVSWARRKFEDYFANRIKQLTYTFPENASTSTGLPFWSPPKRFPTAVTFTPEDPTCLAFVTAGAILRAATFGIEVPDWARDGKRMAEAVAKVEVGKFVPKQGVKIVTDEKATSAATSVGDDGKAIAELVGRLKEGSKGLPKEFRMVPVQFEKDDDTNYHMDLMAALANLRARNYTIGEMDKLKAKFIAGRIIPARLQPIKRLLQLTHPLSLPPVCIYLLRTTTPTTTWISWLPSPTCALARPLGSHTPFFNSPTPLSPPQDDDTNYHMDLMAALANLRARNYTIGEVDKLKAKFIAGRIIPAIATTTALATGLVCLELYKLYKVLQGAKASALRNTFANLALPLFSMSSQTPTRPPFFPSPSLPRPGVPGALQGLVCLELYKVLQGAKASALRNTFANLALPLFSMAEPVPPKSVKHKELTWTVWDRWTVEGDVTMQELLDWFKAKGLDAYSISCGQALLFNSLFPRHKERLPRKVLDIAKEVAKLEVPAYRRHFDVVVACEDDEGEDVDVPLISIKFR